MDHDHGCNVCQSFRPRANLRKRAITRVAFGDHVVSLCETHRRIAERSDVTTFDALRDFYGESDGRRSYVPRRASALEMTPDGERRSGGRRSTDA